MSKRYRIKVGPATPESIEYRWDLYKKVGPLRALFWKNGGIAESVEDAWRDAEMALGRQKVLESDIRYCELRTEAKDYG